LAEYPVDREILVLCLRFVSSNRISLGIVLKPSVFISHIPFLGKPGEIVSLTPSQPPAIIAIAVRRPPLEGNKDKGILPHRKDRVDQI